MTGTKDGYTSIFKPTLRGINLPIYTPRGYNLIDVTPEKLPSPDDVINDKE